MSLDQFRRIVIANEPFILQKEAIERVEESYRFLRAFSSGKIIYGINTGFGPMAQNLITSDNLIDLQYNIIRSHSSGLGGYVSEIVCRGILLARLNCMLQGYSGVHPDLVVLMRDMLHKGISPCIPSHGGVGASGDLVQLAHLALAVIGEGEVYFNGEIIPAGKAFSACGLEALKIRLREGIALMNGVSGMTALAAMNLISAINALQWSVALSAILNELVESYDDPFSEELNIKKQHSGQREVAEMIRSLLEGSTLIMQRGHDNYLCSESNILNKKLQEYYSLRCIPQIAGPVLDTIRNALSVIENELNSSSDNPVIDARENNIFHGGNFHGEYISMEMDKLKIAITKLSILAERQLNFLMNRNINKILPPFINNATPGLNFGFQGIQYTATSTTAENMMLANPVSVHNIPSNNDNQDVVSMGFNSASVTSRVVKNTFEVLAIEAAAIVQAVAFLNIEEKLAKNTREIYRKLSGEFDVITEDTPQYKNLDSLRGFMEATNLQILKTR